MKKIKGFEYKIDEAGRVWSIRNKKFIRPYDSVGYLKVDLYNNWDRRKVFIHQLMAETFLVDSKIEGSIVNHKDGDRKNNSIDNLEWSTYSLNIQHAYDVLGMKCPPRAKGRKSVHARRIIQMNVNGGVVKKWGAICEAQLKYGQSIERCLSGRSKTAYGFKWRYA